MRNWTTVLVAGLVMVTGAARAQDGGTPPPAKANAQARTPEGLVALDSPEKAREVCLATRPTARVAFEGNAVEQATAKEAHREARKEALGRLYKVQVPSQGFSFGAYDAKEHKLAIDFRRPLRALYGAVTVAIPSDTSLLLPMSPEAAQSALAAHNARAATLDLFFVLDEGAGAPCAGSAAADVYTVSGEAVAAALHDGMGTLLARAETPRADAHRALLGGYSGVPTVSIGAVQTDEGMDPVRIAQRLQSVTEPVRRCYEARLTQQPSASGVVVLGVAVGGSGAVESVDFIADALGDPMLRECVESAFSKTRFEGVKGLFRVPVELKLTPRK